MTILKTRKELKDLALDLRLNNIIQDYKEYNNFEESLKHRAHYYKTTSYGDALDLLEEFGRYTKDNGLWLLRDNINNLWKVKDLL